MFDVGEIESRINELWRAAAEGKDALVRACTLNLVVPCEDANEVSRDVALLTEHHPCRAIVVACGAESEASRFQAAVSSHCHRGLGGRKTCSEQVTIEAHGDALALVADTVLQILCEDLPVYTWWRRGTLASDPLLAPLARLSKRLLLDSSALPDPAAALAVLAASASDTDREGCIADLAWTRLEPWRGIVASLFDAPSTRGLLDGIQALKISAGGQNVAAAYLAGWLAARLGFRLEGERILSADGRALRVDLVRDPALADGEIGSVRIECRTDGHEARVNAARIDSSSDLVRLWIEMVQTRPLPRVLKLPPRDQVALLSREIERELLDPVFRAALPYARSFLGSIP